MNRNLQPELLDVLTPEDPRAMASRRDLIRLNRLMRHPRITAEFLGSRIAGRGRIVIIELGAGDGQTLLAAARFLGRRSPAQRIDAVLVDRHRLITSRTESEFEKLNWNVQTVVSDVFEFLRSKREPADVVLANLFLHHFENDPLKEMLALSSRLTRSFIALEPRRSTAGLFLSSFSGLLGCSSVTRHDARISIEAGFAGNELSNLWPKSGAWRLDEKSSGIVTHVFTAVR